MILINQIIRQNFPKNHALEGISAITAFFVAIFMR